MDTASPRTVKDTSHGAKREGRSKGRSLEYWGKGQSQWACPWQWSVCLGERRMRPGLGTEGRPRVWQWTPQTWWRGPGCWGWWPLAPHDSSQSPECQCPGEMKTAHCVDGKLQTRKQGTTKWCSRLVSNTDRIVLSRMFMIFKIN